MVSLINVRLVLFKLQQQRNRNMGAIVSRRKRTTIITSQPNPAPSSHTTAHDGITPSVPSNQASQQPIVHESHDDDSENSDENDHSDTGPESSDGEEQLDHTSTRSVSVSTKSNESVKDTSSTHENGGEKSTTDKAYSDEEFTTAWRKALLEDLDISISDNVKIVRIFTSSTFTGTLEEMSSKKEYKPLRYISNVRAILTFSTATEKCICRLYGYHEHFLKLKGILELFTRVYHLFLQDYTI